jgi:hypothetical protein
MPNFPNIKIFRPGGSRLSAGHFPSFLAAALLALVLKPRGGITIFAGPPARPRYPLVDPRPGEVLLL